MAIHSDRPVGQAPTTTQAAKTDAAAPAPAEPKRVSLGDSDNLVVAVRKGDTLYQMARMFADDTNNDGSITGKELTGFVADIKKANGGNPSMTVDQPLKIPTKDSSYLAKDGAMVQKWLQLNPDASAGKVEDFIWRDVERAPAPDGWNGISVPDQHGITHTFLVSDNLNEDGDPQAGPVAVRTLEQFMKEFMAGQ